MSFNRAAVETLLADRKILADCIDEASDMADSVRMLGNAIRALDVQLATHVAAMLHHIARLEAVAAKARQSCNCTVLLGMGGVSHECSSCRSITSLLSPG